MHGPSRSIATVAKQSGQGGVFVEPFVERLQELQTLGSRASFTGFITAEEQKVRDCTTFSNLFCA